MTGPEERIEERTTETGPDATASEPAERSPPARHWDSLDREAAALLGAVERDLDEAPESEEARMRPAPLGVGRPRLGGPGFAPNPLAPAPRASAVSERPKRWITAVLVAAALTLPFATPAGGPAPRTATDATLADPAELRLSRALER